MLQESADRHQIFQSIASTRIAQSCGRSLGDRIQRPANRAGEQQQICRVLVHVSLDIPQVPVSGRSFVGQALHQLLRL